MHLPSSHGNPARWPRAVTLAALLAACALSAQPVLPAHAVTTTISVNSPAQEVTTATPAGMVNGNCTLGEAILAANGDAAVDGCTSPDFGTGGPFVIGLAAGSGPYTLSAVADATDGANGLPSVTSAITINGNGNLIQRDPTDACPGTVDFRIFRVAAGASLTLNNVTITNGCAGGVSPDGGGIINRGGTVTINNSTLSGNSAGVGGGGISNVGPGTMTVNNSTISGNAAIFGGGGNGGGGIFNSADATMTINNSTISGNTATLGGGLRNDNIGAVTINNSTISDNQSTPGGWAGGVATTGVSSTMVINSTTITSNSSSNGGGIYASSAPVTIRDSIVAAQTSGSDCLVTGTPIVSAGYNIESATTCGFSAIGDMQNTNPLLGPLQDNGGPTLTRALQSGSPAVDMGNSVLGCLADLDGNGSLETTLASDQRGFPYVDIPGVGTEGGTPCDIGAFEFQLPPPPAPADEEPEDEGEPAPVLRDTDFIIKRVDREVAAVGDVLTYTITWANPTDHRLTRVVVEDTFDARLVNLTVVSVSRGTARIDDTTVRVDGFELGRGEQVRLVVQATVGPGARPGDIILNFATLESPDASEHRSNAVRTTIVVLLPATGFRPVATGYEPSRSPPAWLVPALITGPTVGGLLALLWMEMRRRFEA